MRFTCALTTLAVVLLCGSTAFAEAPFTGDLAIADRYWAAQGYPDPCAGQVTVTIDPALADLGDDGAVNATLYGACTIAIRPGQEPVERCNTVVHEVGHLRYGHLDDGLAHTGPMAPENLNPTECLPPPPSPRQALIRSIRSGLPKPAAPWKVTCTPNSRRMRCWARSPRARQMRRITARIDGDGSFEWGY